MKNEKPVFTQFNFSFTTFPRQTFVNFFDQKKAHDAIPLESQSNIQPARFHLNGTLKKQLSR